MDDGKLNINFAENDLDFGEPIERIHINGVTLKDIIRNETYKYMSSITPLALTNIVLGMTWNPLWGKKLVVIGDSLISSPTRETSYPSFIAQRNNMTLVHKGRSGERLCISMTNANGVVTNPSCISSYTNDIPKDADFILCQIGANDYVHWDQVDQSTIPDIDMTTNTFKGCWNLLLIGLKKNYPNAKIGMILANNWTENLGQKTEDVIANNSRRERTQWQKIQCQKLNIPVFDPVEDTRNIQYHYVTFPTNAAPTIDELPLSWYERTKREIGTDNSSIVLQNYTFQCPFMVDTQHTTVKGNLYLSFYYERWMKTILISQ